MRVCGGFGLGFTIALALLATAGCGGGGDGGEGKPGSGGSSGSGSAAGTGASTGTGGAGAAGGGGSAGSSAGGGSGGGGGSSFAGSTRVDSGAGNAKDRSADLVIAPDGTLYVSWVDGSDDVHVSRSTDGGKSFEPSVKLDDASIVPIVSMARHPRLAVDAERVAVAFNDQAGTIYLYVSNKGQLAFGKATLVGNDITTDFRDFPKPVFLSDGKLGVAYQGYPTTGARIFLARETKAWASEVASTGAPGLPCECCPLEALRAMSGDLMLAFRNNQNNTREMWSAVAPQGGAFSSFAAASKTEGTIAACPMQGPRVAELSSGKALMVWSGRGQNAGAAMMSETTNGGGAWSGGAAVPGLSADEPTIALGASGKVYIAGVTGNQQSAMLWREADGKTFSSPAPLNVGDGPLSTPQAFGEGGVAALAAVSKAKTVWLVRME